MRATIGSITIASATEAANPLCLFPSTIRPKTKMPVMIVGTPLRMSSTKRTGWAIAGGANSVV